MKRPSPRRREGQEAQRVVLAQGDHVAELHRLSGAADEVDVVEAAEVVQQRLGRGVALQARIVIGVPDQVRVRVALEVEGVLGQPGHRLGPGQQRLAQRVVLRLDGVERLRVEHARRVALVHLLELVGEGVDPRDQDVSDHQRVAELGLGLRDAPPHPGEARPHASADDG